MLYECVPVNAAGLTLFQENKTYHTGSLQYTVQYSTYHTLRRHVVKTVFGESRNACLTYAAVLRIFPSNLEQ